MTDDFLTPGVTLQKQVAYNIAHQTRNLSPDAIMAAK
jgi:hypothetical protein